MSDRNTILPTDNRTRLAYLRNVLTVRRQRYSMARDWLAEANRVRDRTLRGRLQRMAMGALNRERAALQRAAAAVHRALVLLGYTRVPTSRRLRAVGARVSVYRGPALDRYARRMAVAR